jgi:hypothetical protein
VWASCALISHSGVFFASAEPGKMRKRRLRGPRYSERGGRAPLPALTLGAGCFWPMWSSSPATQRLVDDRVQRFDRFRRPRLAGRGGAALAQQIDDLPIHRLPFLHPQPGHIALAAPAPQLPVRVGLRGVAPALPEQQQRQEVGARMAPFGVFRARLVELIRRRLVRVLHRQRRRQHPHRVLHRRAAPGERDARHAWVQRQPCEFTAQRRQSTFAVGLQRAEHLQQAHPFGDVAAIRRVEPGEVVDIAQAQRRHLQDHAGEVGTQDLGVGEGGARGEVILGVQAHGDAGPDAAAAAGTLVGGRLRHRLDLQPLHTLARRVAVDARGAGVDDVADAGHGHRGLGDVGGEHDARRAAGCIEHAVLLRRRQARVQRQHLGVREAARQRARQFVDLAFARQEHQCVADTTAGPQLGHRVGHRVFGGLLVGGRAVARLHRMQPPLHAENRRTAKMPGELLRVQRGRGDDDLEIRPARQQALEPAQQQVDVEAALMRLVDDQRVVGQQFAVAAQLGEQDAVGHQLHQRALGDAAVEARFAADQFADLRFQLARDAAGDAACREPARLGVADQPAAAATQFQAQLRQLRGLAGAGLAADDDHLMIADRRQQFLARLHHRQVRRIGDGRGARALAVLRRQRGALQVTLETRGVEASTALPTLQLLTQARGITRGQLRRIEAAAQGRQTGPGVRRGAVLRA